MVRLKVTSKGQVTLQQEMLDHLGAKPGDELDIHLVGGLTTSSEGRKGKIEDLFGMFANINGKSLSIDEMNEAIAAGWAGEVES